MINKITNIVHIIVLLIYSLIMTVFNKINGIIKIKKYQNEENILQEQEQEEEIRESFQNNNSTNNKTIESQISVSLYKPTNLWANNINDYNDYSIEKTSPDNITLPKNYALQTEDYEKENTEYDYKDFNSTDGSGVHLQAHWDETSVARPWFLSRKPPIDCSSQEISTSPAPVETTTSTTYAPVPKVCNNTYVLLPNVDIDGNEGVNYEGKNDFNKCCNATQESHDGFYKFRPNFSTGACYYKKIRNDLDFYFKIKDVTPISEGEIEDYYGVFFLKETKYNEIMDINHIVLPSIKFEENTEYKVSIKNKESAYKNPTIIKNKDENYISLYFDIELKKNDTKNVTDVILKPNEYILYIIDNIINKDITIALQY